jgi:hypothetical protein
MRDFIAKYKSNQSSQIIILIVFFEFLMFIFSGLSFSFLSGNQFFNIAVDPVYWIFYSAGIPQLITSFHWLGIIADATIFILLLILFLNIERYNIARFCFLFLLIYYVTLTGYHTHRNYQSGFFLVLFPFLFQKKSNRHYAFSMIRYFLLFFYFSAGLIKIMSPSFFEINHFSNHLIAQFAPYYLEGNTGFRTSLNLFLINNNGFSYALFLCSVVVELIMTIGFFTRKFDKWLGVLLLTFHLFNWLIMDIAPFGQLAFLSILLLEAFTAETSEGSH